MTAPFKFVDKLRDDIAELKAERQALQTDAAELDKNTSLAEPLRDALVDAIGARAAAILSEIDAKQERS